jgi:hypothetical protein
MIVMQTTQLITQRSVQPTGCCPPFDPVPWQDQEITWHGKAFVKDHVTCSKVHSGTRATGSRR